MEIYKHHNGAFSNKNDKAGFGTFRNAGVQEETPEVMTISCKGGGFM